MEKSSILSSDLLDILFDGRNKNYGAYQLRKTYDKRVRSALAGTFIFCLLFTVGSILANNRKKSPVDLYGPVIQLSDIETVKPKDDPKPKPKPKTVQKPAEPQAMVKNLVPVIVKEEVVDPHDEIRPQEDLNIAPALGNKDADGSSTTIIQAPVEEKGSGPASPRVETPEETAFIPVQIPAHFPGGIDAWRKYLERNLNKDLPSENGAPAGTYTVTVSFTVDKAGVISDVKAENDPGYGTMEEAIKVIKKGPNWTPAEQNGKKVIYRHKQTITFRVAVD